MNMLWNVLFFAAGIAVDMLYQRNKRIAAKDAYLEGFKHAKREEEYYRDGVYDGHNNNVVCRVNEKVAEMPEPKHCK